MLNWKTFLMTLLVGSASYVNADIGSEVNFEAGYRRDSIGWSVQVPACDPVLRTRTKFDNIDIFQLGVNGRTTLGCNFYARAAFSGGWILDGDFKNKSTRFFSVSEGPFSDVGFDFSSDNTVDGRFVIDLSAAIGYPFYFCDCSMFIAPVVGYAFDEQNLEVNSHETNSGDSSALFASGGECCDQKFVSRWYGPFIGLDFVYRPCNQCWGLYAELEYHYARYKTKRHNFNDFRAFNQFNSTARHAHGWVFTAGIDYDFSCCWTVGLDVTVRDFGATRRHRECEESELSDFVSSDSRVKTHADWHSFAVNLTVGREF